MNGESARVEELTRQLATHAQSKQLSSALETFGKIESEGLKPNAYTYAALINAYVVSGDLVHAHQTLDRMKVAGFPPNVIVLTTLLKGHCAVGDMPRARTLLENMASAVPPVHPDTRTLNTFMRGCVRVGDLGSARWAFSMLRTWQLTPSHTSTLALGRTPAR